MPRRRINYGEGDVIAVPLADGTWALGLVARMDGKGALIAYFFGPKRVSVPASTKGFAEKPDQAVLVVKCGHLGLLEEKWKVVGRIQDWDRAAWPIPIFVRTDLVSGEHWKVVYADENLTREVTTLPCSNEEAMTLPKDGASGDVAVEKKLNKILCQLSLSG